MTIKLREHKRDVVPITLEGRIELIPIMNLGKEMRLLYLAELSSRKDIPYILKNITDNKNGT